MSESLPSPCENQTPLEEKPLVPAFITAAATIFIEDV